MKAYTPGPWEHKRCNDDEIIIEVGDSTGWRKHHPGAYIARIGGWGYAGNGNAALIAAAPDLLDALKELRDLMEEVRTGDYKPDSFTNQIADAAIAKAEG